MERKAINIVVNLSTIYQSDKTIYYLVWKLPNGGLIKEYDYGRYFYRKSKKIDLSKLAMMNPYSNEWKKQWHKKL